MFFKRLPLVIAIVCVANIALISLPQFLAQDSSLPTVAMVSPALTHSPAGQLGQFRPDNTVDGNDFSGLLRNPLGNSDLRKADQLAGSVKFSEWLGPLAPIAISPFFGITLLAGISQFGSESLPFNEFISNNPVLSNPATFWVFLMLTFLTSLPRLTKVSKPAAQAIDQLETYAAIVTIVLLRVLATSPEIAESVPVAMQAGVFSVSADVLMSIAAIVNIVVINTVKFFFEVSVWLVPFPLVDAALEVANKSACAALMAIYAYSPGWATAINLLMFFACLIAFRWIHTRTVYLRTMLLDPIWAMVSQRYATPDDHLVVFPKQSLGPFRAKSKLVMKRNVSGWLLTRHRFLLPNQTVEIEETAGTAKMKEGLIANRIEFANGDHLLFSRRHARHLPALAKQLQVGYDRSESIA